MNRIGLILVTILLFQFSVAQPWIWDTILLEKGAIQITRDNQGNILTYPKYGNEITRYSNSLAVQWKLNLPPKFRISNITCAHDQSFYLLGSFIDTIQLGSQLLVSKGKEDIILARFNGWGQLIWVQQLGSKGRDLPGEVAVSGFVVAITGCFGDTISIAGNNYFKRSGLDLFVAKLTSSGSLSKITIAENDTSQNGQAPYYYSYGKEINISPNGDIFVLATIYANVRIGTFMLTSLIPSGDSRDVFIKLDDQLNVIWSSYYSIYGDAFFYMSINSKSEIYYINKYSTAHVGLECSLNKISADGVNTNIYGIKCDYWSWSDIGGITMDEADNVTIAGSYSGFWPWPAKPSVSNLFIRQYFSDGNLKWQFTDTVSVSCTTLCELRKGEFLIGGNFDSTLFLNSLLIGKDSVEYSTGKYRKTSRFMALMDSRLVTNTKETIKAEDKYYVYPNPSKGKLVIRCPYPSILKVTDLSGVKLQSHEMEIGNNSVELSYLSQGIYILSFETAQRTWTKKLIIE